MVPTLAIEFAVPKKDQVISLHKLFLALDYR